MGLDMYLYKKEAANEQAILDALDEVEGWDWENECLTPALMEMPTEELGYWRKVNAVHDWFVRNVQNGRDECQMSYVPIAKAQELYDTCVAILTDKSKASKLLPTASGFFFGSTDYDEWYYEGVENTAEIMYNALNDLGENEFIMYQSSW
jgi:hypothetical protein